MTGSSLIISCDYFPYVSSGIIFAFSQDNYDVGEGDGDAEVCIDLVSGVLAANTPVEISTQPGTASGKFNNNSCKFVTIINSITTCSK